MHYFNSFFKKISGPIVVLTAAAFGTTQLSGCATPVLYAAQLIPTAFVGYQLLPGEAKVELAKPGGGALSSDLPTIKTIMTDNLYSHEYLQNEKELFSQVKLTKKAPISTASAASMARQGGYDAFLMVDTGGQTARGGLTVKIVYGSAVVTMVSKKGEVLYKQTATLIGKANSPETPSERQVAEALAKAIVDDLKESKLANQAGTSKTSSPSFAQKVKGLFD